MGTWEVGVLAWAGGEGNAAPGMAQLYRVQTAVSNGSGIGVMYNAPRGASCDAEARYSAALSAEAPRRVVALAIRTEYNTLGVGDRG